MGGNGQGFRTPFHLSPYFWTGPVFGRGNSSNSPVWTSKKCDSCTSNCYILYKLKPPWLLCSAHKGFCHLSNADTAAAVHRFGRGLSGDIGPRLRVMPKFSIFWTRGLAKCYKISIENKIFMFVLKHRKQDIGSHLDVGLVIISFN